MNSPLRSFSSVLPSSSVTNDNRETSSNSNSPSECSYGFSSEEDDVDTDRSRSKKKKSICQAMTSTLKINNVSGEEFSSDELTESTILSERRRKSRPRPAKFESDSDVGDTPFNPSSQDDADYDSNSRESTPSPSTIFRSKSLSFSKHRRPRNILSKTGCRKRGRIPSLSIHRMSKKFKTDNNQSSSSYSSTPLTNSIRRRHRKRHARQHDSSASSPEGSSFNSSGSCRQRSSDNQFSRNVTSSPNITMTNKSTLLTLDEKVSRCNQIRGPTYSYKKRSKLDMDRIKRATEPRQIPIIIFGSNETDSPVFEKIKSTKEDRSVLNISYQSSSSSSNL